MKKAIFVALIFTGATIVATPPRLLADKVFDQYRRAGQLFSQGDFQGAQKELEAVLQKKHNYQNAKILLGLTLTKLSEQAEKARDRARAVANLHEALSLDPDEAYWHSALAKLLHMQGNEEEAMKECSQAAKLSPDDSDLAQGCGFQGKQEINVDDRKNPRGEALAAAAASGPPVYEPVPLYKPDPSYTEKARQVGLRGFSVLWIVVGADGDVKDATVVEPLGLGLDENALRTVLTWKFKPATRGGVPVPVRAMVQVSFFL